MKSSIKLIFFVGLLSISCSHVDNQNEASIDASSGFEQSDDTFTIIENDSIEGAFGINNINSNITPAKFKALNINEEYFDNVSYHIKIAIEGKTYVVTIDSVTKILQLESDQIEEVLRIPVNLQFGKPIVTVDTDFNSDHVNDLLIKIGTGGTAGSIYLLCLYDSSTGTFVYDESIELRNIVISDNEITSKYMWSESIFRIESFKIFRVEESVYLRKTNGDSNLRGLMEVRKFDKNGKVVMIDTVKIP